MFRRISAFKIPAFFLSLVVMSCVPTIVDTEPQASTSSEISSPKPTICTGIAKPDGVFSWWDGDLGAGLSGVYDVLKSYHLDLTNLSVASSGQVGQAIDFNSFGSVASTSASASSSFDFPSGFSIVAWVKNSEKVPSTTRMIASKKNLSASVNNSFKNLSAYESFDLYNGLSTNLKIFNGSGYDGRYVYAIPSKQSYTGSWGTTSTYIVRYDTRGSSAFTNSASWETFNLASVSSSPYLNATAYSNGSVFDGRYLYILPGSTNVIMRYDTTAAFANASSWSIYDPSVLCTTSCGGFGASVFDGQYVYFADAGTNSNIIRFDSTLPFTSGASWSSVQAKLIPDLKSGGYLTNTGYTGAFVTQSYIYFSGLYTTRYDRSLPLGSISAWSGYDSSNVSGYCSGCTGGRNGGAFDGRYLYLYNTYANSPAPSPYNGIVVRYDTEASFAQDSSWSALNTYIIGADRSGPASGAVYDGRYTYSAPFDSDNGRAVVIRRYDTLGTFTDSNSWQLFNATNTMPQGGVAGASYFAGGMLGIIFDGRYVYYIPYVGSNASTGGVFHRPVVLRYDTYYSSNVSYELTGNRSLGSGISFSVLGPSFMVNTSNGSYRAQSIPLLDTQWHLVAGVYNSTLNKVNLYIDGVLVESVNSAGTLASTTSNAKFQLGGSNNSSTSFFGKQDEVLVFDRAVDVSTIQNIYQSGKSGICKP